MSDLLFYKFNILAGILVAYCLGLIGPALISRRQAPFVFSFSQISINILLVSLVFHFEHNKVFLAFIGALVCFLFQKLATQVSAEKENLAHTTIFVGLYSINQLLIAKFPQLQAYSTLHNTGDLVTLLNHEAITISICSGLLTLAFVIFRSPILYFNFKSSTSLFLSQRSFFEKHGNFIILFSYYFLLSLSNLYFGFLFTVGCLFILSLFAGFSSKNEISYFITSAVLLTITIPSAFYYSIQTNTVTVPSILIALLLVFVLNYFLNKYGNDKQARFWI
jgi:ABC-type Mn2+/Zn2+ transport system permease subunit